MTGSTITRVLLGNNLANLDPSDVVGSGGEGTVFRVNVPAGPRGGIRRMAVKIYHDYSPKRAGKLKALLGITGKFPDEVVVPELLAIEEQTAQVVGYGMRMLPAGYKTFEMLFSRKFREAEGITTKDVLDYGLKLHGVLKTLHPNGIRVGDLNSLNELVKHPELALIDADSFDIPGFPCSVATERFLDPRLYGKDLASGQLFTDNDDWYSFLTLLFNALLLVHPYGGVHRSLRSIMARAQAKVPVFDSNVVYPVNAFPPEIVSKDLMDLFHAVFAKGQRGEPKKEILLGYRDVLIGCKSCGLWYPGNLKECPDCLAINNLVIKLGAVIKAIQATELLTSAGTVIYFRLYGSKMYAVAREQGNHFLYIKESLNLARRVALPNFGPGVRYEFFQDKYLAVSREPHKDETEIEIFDISGSSPVFVTKTMTESFTGHSAVFRGTEKYLYRVFGGHILRGQILFGGKLIEDAVAQVTNRQAWLDADPNSDVAVGFYRVFSRYEWFLIKGTGQFKIDLPELDARESLIDRSLRFSARSVLVLRRTEISGVEYIRIEIVDIETGKVTFSKRAKLTDEPLLERIHTHAFSRGAILVPSDADGLTAYDPVTGKTRIFPDAKNFVTDDSLVFQFENGILVLTRNRAIKLVLGNKP